MSKGLVIGLVALVAVVVLVKLTRPAAGAPVPSGSAPLGGPPAPGTGAATADWSTPVVSTVAAVKDLLGVFAGDTASYDPLDDSGEYA